MIRLCCCILAALGMGVAGWFYPSSASALSFYKELVSEEAIPNAELKIDSQGNLHAVFLSKNHEVKYAVKSLANWVIERVEEGGVGAKAQWVSLTLDNLDGVHIAFYDLVNSEVKYGQKVSGLWKIITVAAAYNSQCRLAAYGSEQVWVAFNSSTDTNNPGRIFLACIDTAVPQVNTIETVDAEGDVGYGPCLVLDAGGRPHVTYFDRKSGKLKYAFKDGEWRIFPVADASPGGWQSALVLDKWGWPHIAYYDMSGGDLEYAYKDFWGWHYYTLDSAGNVGQYPALIADPRGRLFFAYYDASNGALKYAYKETFSWRKGTLDPEGAASQYISLAASNLGEMHLLYYSYDPVSKITRLYYGVATLPWVYLADIGEGDVWYKDSIHIISWRTGSSEISSFKIQYSNRFTWITIADNLPSWQREYPWAIPLNAPGSCRIRIIGKVGRSRIFTMDRSPTITLSPPP